MNNSFKYLKILLLGHSGSNNRGCEAIIRSTSALLKKTFGEKAYISVASFRKKEDIRLCIPYIDKYISNAPILKKFFPFWVIHKILRIINFKFILKYLEKINYKEVISYLKEMDYCLFVGGDSYCYGYKEWLYTISSQMNNACKRILWGCSINPEIIDDEMVHHLKSFDLIVARESITYEKLITVHANDNIRLFPDPAFTMDKEPVLLPDNWLEKNVVGINISPLIFKYENNSGIIFKNVWNLVDFIIRNYNSNIALIPHVTWKENNDLEPLLKLSHHFSRSGRIMLIGSNFTAPQYKYIISKCRLFIGARTHATIAAYSTCVPTLALGYSVKAKGIAKDIFGVHENYVLPVQTFKNQDELIHAFNWLIKNEDNIRKHLHEFMPGYIEKAWQAGEELKKLFEAIK